MDPGRDIALLSPGFIHILENLKNTGIWQLEFHALDILEFCRKSWKILEYEPVFGAFFLSCLYFVMPLNYCNIVIVTYTCVIILVHIMH